MAIPVSSPAMPQAQPAAVAPDRILSLGNGYWVSQIISAACRFHFFTLIASGTDTAPAIAEAAATDREGTRMVLDGLAAVQLLTKLGNRYTLAPDAEAYLVDGRPGSLAPLLAGHVPLTWDAWGRLADLLAGGRAQAKFDANDEHGAAFFARLIRPIMPLSLGPADATAEHLGVGTRRKGLRILDIGAGSGAWSIPFARRDATGEVTAFDLPAVLDETRRIAAEHGVADRYRMKAGDLRTADFGRDAYDLAILGNICHGLTPDANRDLFARAHRALKPNGELIIADMLPNEERTGPPFPVLFAVNMYVNGGEDTYPLSDYRGWLRDAGFAGVATLDTRRSHSPVIIATK